MQIKFQDVTILNVTVMPILVHLIDCTTTGILHDSFYGGSLLTSQETTAESTTKALASTSRKAHSLAANLLPGCLSSYKWHENASPLGTRRLLLLTYDMQSLYLFSIFLWHQWRILYDSYVRKKVLYESIGTSETIYELISIKLNTQYGYMCAHTKQIM